MPERCVSRTLPPAWTPSKEICATHACPAPSPPNAIGQAKPLSRSLADSQSSRAFLAGAIRPLTRLGSSGLHVGAFLFDERLYAFAQQSHVEGFLEGFVEPEIRQSLRGRFIFARQRDD